jgi:tyrosyl-tRNA synthetase
MGTSNVLDELEWRGLIAQSTDRDALAEHLAAGPSPTYSGFDPTAPSLHAGHLIPLLTCGASNRRAIGRSCWPAAQPG